MTITAPEFLQLQQAVAGRFSLERELGRGGMGIVFLARDVSLERQIAIKLLPPLLARDQACRDRFLREARIAARLAHPHIVPIHQVEEHGDVVFFVMSFVEGITLGERIRREGWLAPSAALRIMKEVAWALGYAHRLEVVHRDVKPDNILIERGSGRALVTDFGIARAAGTDTLSGQGEIVGTAHYMSPEQATGDTVDGRSDIYSLGVTAFHALTGRLPFEGGSLPTLMHLHLNVPAPRVAAQGRPMPARLAEAVDRCLLKAPEDRWPTAEALADALTEAGAVPRVVPPQIRSLLRLVSQDTTALAVVGTLAFWLFVLGPGAWRAFVAPGSYAVVMLGGFLALTVVASSRELIHATRRLNLAGYDVADVRRTLADEGTAILEEARLDGSQASSLNSAREYLIGHSPLAALVGIPLLWLGLAGDILPAAVAAGAAALIGGVLGYLAGPSVDRDSPLRAVGFVERMVVGRLGNLLFRLAAVGGVRPVSAGLPDQLTELLLATQVEDLLGQLPPALRERFAEVDGIIRRLNSNAAALRRRNAVLGDALVQGVPASGPGSEIGRQALLAARSVAQRSLEMTVAALENLRLGLLRLRAGVGTPQDLTAEIQRAREVGEAIDRELQARSEVEGLLERSVTAS